MKKKRHETILLEITALQAYNHLGLHGRHQGQRGNKKCYFFHLLRFEIKMQRYTLFSNPHNFFFKSVPDEPHRYRTTDSFLETSMGFTGWNPSCRQDAGAPKWVRDDSVSSPTQVRHFSDRSIVVL